LITRTRQLAAVAVAGALGWFSTAQPDDLTLFSTAGRWTITGHLSQVFSGTDNESGPLQDLLSRLLTLGGDSARPAPLAFAIVNAALMVLVLHGCARRHRPGAEVAGPRELLVAGYTALWLAAPDFWGGHPMEAVIPILWVGAAGLERRGRSTGAAFALAAAAGIAPWGVLGFPCLLGAGQVRRGLRTILLGSGLTAAVYLPFLSGSRSGALSHRWPVSHNSLVHLVMPHLYDVGWDFRLGQAAFIVAVCAVITMRQQNTPWVAAVAATTTGLLRVATDPVDLGYYWVPVAVAATMLLIAVPRLRSRLGFAALACAYIGWATSTITEGSVAAPLAAVTAVVLLLRAAHRTPTARHLAADTTSDVGSRHRPWSGGGAGLAVNASSSVTPPTGYPVVRGHA
jgi:hypothetical protein